MNVLFVKSTQVIVSGFGLASFGLTRGICGSVAPTTVSLSPKRGAALATSILPPSALVSFRSPAGMICHRSRPLSLTHSLYLGCLGVGQRPQRVPIFGLAQ